jgi:stage IV sporulation protein B
MFKRIVIKSIGVLFCVGFIMIMVNTNFVALSELPQTGDVTYNEINDINKQSQFGKFVTADLEQKDMIVGGEKNKISTLKFKLFGIIPVKEVSVNVGEEKEVFVGGIPLGFSLNTKGLIVVGNNSVLTQEGNKETQKDKTILAGDILTEINGKEITSVSVVEEELNDFDNEYVNLKILRKDKTIDVKLKPAKDMESDKYKLGLWVKNSASGVGTLTFVDQDKNFGALGHPITDYETGSIIPVQDGKIYNCSLVGISKGERGKPGELKCLFLQGKNSKGNVSKNTNSGVFGDISNSSNIVDENKKAIVGNRINVKPGKAYIVSSVSGVREEYEIEIIKANNQKQKSDKSIIFRVKDKRLLSMTGGIVQGMSGSPILQDGKIIGAVTHVFLNDSTKGYGIYIDWMLQEIA